MLTDPRRAPDDNDSSKPTPLPTTSTVSSDMHATEWENSEIVKIGGPKRQKFEVSPKTPRRGVDIRRYTYIHAGVHIRLRTHFIQIILRTCES